ncbi:muramoyltetrapeptide carboxypeptidase LdcA involved in peptidoglycan recycling [Microvirga lupini]|uniref:Muramoyltetrapeptide carboxypeptidase LdcA involved in peptidoglycan recycling n=1 Tax=Microvirga lupini TaxID=420324 RepID=A0A7W4YW33_9HYPH|nr:S66 peptidase family protein [Microvirga lupini]MBB3018441.1 muramoyltetrapeptide carboxypeptidase LdcA involved in peptidoglycan recycling [Microvirga lupini]
MTDRWWQRPLVKPQALRPGDRVAIVSTSWGGPAVFPHRYEAGKRYLTDAFGLVPVEMPHALRDADWLDRNPQARAEDIHTAFADPSIKGVIASIGGDDAIRLIPHIDLSVIADNPKVFLGYSDPTVLHFGCLKAGLRSFYGPTIMAGFAENGGMHAYAENALRKAVFDVAPIGEIEPNREGWTVEHLPWKDPENQTRRRKLTPSTGPRTLQGSGTVQGNLIGGCAEVLEMLKGSDWWPPLDYWDGAILFYETSEEVPAAAQVLRWLRNFAAQGILQRLSGIVLGRPGGQTDEAYRQEQERAVLRALEEAALTHLPVLAELDFGHTDPIATLPYGAMAEIDCALARLTILEPGVADIQG